MKRGLDHIVHAVHDLDAAAALYRRMGFNVGARNRHAWGTHNHIVQLPGFFIEILTVAEPDKLGPDGFSQHFGARNRDFLHSREGFSYLMLESSDAKADAQSFARDHIAASDALTFSRKGTRPDGAEMTVGFSLAFARHAASPHAGFAVCQQHDPDTFWNTVLQAHPNTAVRVAGVVLVAENPTDHHVFLSAFSGERELQSSSSGVAVTTPRGDIQIFDPTAFRDRFGVTVAADGAGAVLTALRIAVADLTTTAAVLRDSGVAAAPQGRALVVAPQTASGATLVFEPG